MLVPLHLTRDESASVQCGSGASRVVKNFKGEKIFDIRSCSLLCWFSLLLDPVAGEWVWWWRLGGGVWVLDSPVVVVVVSRVGCRGWGRVGCWWWTGSGLISGRNGPPTLVGCCKKYRELHSKGLSLPIKYNSLFGVKKKCNSFEFFAWSEIMHKMGLL